MTCLEHIQNNCPYKIILLISKRYYSFRMNASLELKPTELHLYHSIQNLLLQCKVLEFVTTTNKLHIY